MKKPVKALRRTIFTIIIVLLILIVAIKLYANSAVKWAVETAGTKTLQVDVKVDSASLDILTGTVGLKQLAIDNPEGYSTNTKLLDMKTGKCKVNAASLLSDTVKIKEIKLDGINVNLEQKDIRGSNIQVVLKNIQAMEMQPSAKKLLIEVLEISNINANVKVTIPGVEGEDINLPLKTIRMTNLGSDNKLDTAKLISQILVAITIAIAEEGGGVIPGDILNPLKTRLRDMDGITRTLLNEGLKMIDPDAPCAEEIETITEEIQDLLRQND